MPSTQHYLLQLYDEPTTRKVAKHYQLKDNADVLRMDHVWHTVEEGTKVHEIV